MRIPKNEQNTSLLLKLIIVKGLIFNNLEVNATLDTENVNFFKIFKNSMFNPLMHKVIH